VILTHITAGGSSAKTDSAFAGGSPVGLLRAALAPTAIMFVLFLVTR